MDKLEAVAKKLAELKEELNKNINMSYSAPPNAVAKKEYLSLFKNGQWALQKAKCKKCGMDPCDCK